MEEKIEEIIQETLRLLPFIFYKTLFLLAQCSLLTLYCMSATISLQFKRNKSTFQAIQVMEGFACSMGICCCLFTRKYYSICRACLAFSAEIFAVIRSTHIKRRWNKLFSVSMTRLLQTFCASKA